MIQTQILRRLAFVLEPGGTLKLTENARLVQGSFGFVMLQVDALITQLDDDNSCVEMLTSRHIIDQTGMLALHKGQKHGMIYVGRITADDGKQYRRFERPLPKTFTEDSGDIQIDFTFRSVILNANEDGKIVSKKIQAQISSVLFPLKVYPGGGLPKAEVIENYASKCLETQINANTSNIDVLANIVHDLPGGISNAADIRITDENPKEGTIFLNIE